MKFIVTVCSLFLISTLVQAQISILASDLPGAGDNIQVTNCAVTGVNPGEAGANRTWNFSGLVSQRQDTLQYRNTLQTPYSIFFLNFYVFGIKGQDLTVGGFGLQNVWDYYLKDNSQYAIRGLGFTFQGVPLGATYSQNQRIFRLPLRFNDTDSSAYSITIQIPDIGRYKGSGYRKYKVDGWGKITTPFGTFDCLRTESYINGIDSLTVAAFGLNFSFGIPVERYEYAWYAKNQKAPILQIEGRFAAGTFIPTRVFYRGFDQNPSTSVSGFTLDGWKVFPNPAVHGWQMEFPVNVIGGNLSIFDVQGKLVKSISIAEAAVWLDMKECQAGWYTALLQKDGITAMQQMVLTR